MLGTNPCQPYPKVPATPENRVLLHLHLHLHTPNLVVSLRHLDYCLISLSTTCYKAFLSRIIMVCSQAQSGKTAKSDLVHRLGFLYSFYSDSSTACLRTESRKCPTLEIVRASASLSLLRCSVMMLQIKLGISPKHCAENQYRLVSLNHEQHTSPVRLHLILYIIDTGVEAHMGVQRSQCSHHGLPHQ